jgi:hypothetical protein
MIIVKMAEYECRMGLPGADFLAAAMTASERPSKRAGSEDDKVIGHLDDERVVGSTARDHARATLQAQAATCLLAGPEILHKAGPWRGGEAAQDKLVDVVLPTGILPKTNLIQ